MPQSPSNILLLVSSLPAPHDPDLVFRMKNSFIFQIMRNVAAGRNVLHPLFVPRFPRLLKAACKFRGLEVHFPAARDEIYEGIAIETVRYLHLPGRYIRTKADALQRKLAGLRARPELIHCHTVYDLGLVGLELKKNLDIPLVVSIYGSDVNLLFETGPARPSQEIIDSTTLVLRSADAVTCVSNALAGRVAELGVDREKIHWIPNGIEKSIFQFRNQQQEKAGLGWESGRLNVLFVGNIYESKGLGDLVEAVSILDSKYDGIPDFVVRVAGRPNDYLDVLLARIEELGLKSRFEFLGLQTQDRVAAMMSASDLFCLPSWREGWPCVVLEAIASGCPVVATDVGGIPEMVTGDEVGILGPPRNPAGLALNLAAGMRRSWDRQVIAAHAEPYTYDKLALKVDEVYREVCKG